MNRTPAAAPAAMLSFHKKRKYIPPMKADNTKQRGLRVIVPHFPCCFVCSIPPAAKNVNDYHFFVCRSEERFLKK